MSNAQPKLVPEKSLRVAFGPVAIVRAIPSREVSVINIEVPEDFHVEVTNLLYNRDCLITLSTFAGAKYGVLDPASPELQHSDQVEMPPSNAGGELQAVHGRVSGVRAVPTRGISVISVEVPEEAHVDVTQMLYGRDVIIMPTTLGKTTPYGVVAGRGKSVHSPNRHAGGITNAGSGTNYAILTRPVDTQGPGVADGSRVGNMFHLPIQIDLVKWAGARCTEAAFQDFLAVRNEAQAVEAVRTICGIESRRELITNQRARSVFMERIYGPFNSGAGAPS